jgi:hypothetical protein
MAALFIVPYILKLVIYGKLDEELKTETLLCRWCIALIVVVVGFFVISAFMGWTKASNDWFFASGLQPYAALLTWTIFILLGHPIIFKKAAVENV